MATLALYCDDSGTHAASPCAVAACYVAPVAQWEGFVRDWELANRVEKFGTFHMADFVGKHKQFDSNEWSDPDKRKRVIQRLINIIKTRATICFFAVVEKRGYDLEMPRDWIKRHHLGSHYTFAVRMCMGRLLKWRRLRGHKGSIQFVFDQMSKGKGEIDKVFEQHLSDSHAPALDVGIVEHGWGFQDKRIVLPLQAADILAWETLWYMQNVLLPEKKKAIRKSYEALLDVPFQGGYHDQQSLKRLVEFWKKNKTINNDLP